MKKISVAEKVSGMQMLGSSNQSDCTKAHLNLYVESKGTPPEEICKDGLYFDFGFNLNH